jgi:glycosyltransferase involved in cell wall biosynthesis
MEIEQIYHVINVLMVTAWSPEIEAGGVSTVIRTLARSLAPTHKVNVLVSDWASKKLRRTQGAGLSCYHLRLRLPINSNRLLLGIPGWLFYLPMTLLALKRLIREEKIDVVHLHFASAYQFYFRILRLFGGPPYIVTLHRGDTVNFDNRPLAERLLTLWVLRGANCANAVSNWLAKLAQGTFPGMGKVRCIYNGIDISNIEEIARENSIVASDFVPPDEFCLIVANVTHYKGQDIAIEAWARLRQQLPNMHLVIVGEARELWPDCVDLVDRLGCADRVHMVGPKPRAEVIRLMARAIALVAPSRNEGFGLVVVEAGVVGLPVICTHIDPFIEIVENGNRALIVAPEDPAALAEAVVILAGNPNLRISLSRALKQRVHAEFSSEQMARRYLEIYEEALGRPRACVSH